MESEQVLDVSVRRYIIKSEGSFPDVLDRIFNRISRPDITSLSATSRQAPRTSSSALSSDKRRALLGSCGSGS
jgi:hypothetical protein